MYRVRAFGRRWIALFATAVCAALALGTASSPLVGAQGIAPSTGHSYSQTLQIDPRTAGLGYQVTFGAAITDHLNTVGRAQAQMINFGVIGTAATAPGCDGDSVISPDWLPKPLKIDSREPGADKGKTNTNGPFEEAVRASNRPFASGASRIAPVDIGGIVTFLGGRSETVSGLDENDTATAVAEVHISGISFVGGAVKLSGLHWRSTSRLDKGGQPSQFSIDRVEVAGRELPAASPGKQLAQVNAALRPLGLELGVPRVHTDNGTTFVDPLRVAIVPSALRDEVASALVTRARPVRSALFDYLIENAPCDVNPAAAILVADIVALSVTGGGSFGLNFGGTQAAVRPVATAGANFLTDRRPESASNASAPAALGDSPAVVGGGTDAQRLPQFVNRTDRSGGATSRRVGAVAADAASDNARWVALAVIGLAAVLVEGEVRLRRRPRDAS